MSLSSICYWKNEIQHLVWLKIFYFIDLRCFIIFDPIISVIYNSKPSIFIIHEARWLEHCVINITSRHPVSQILKHSPLHFTNRLWCLTHSGKKILYHILSSLLRVAYVNSKVFSNVLPHNKVLKIYQR